MAKAANEDDLGAGNVEDVEVEWLVIWYSVFVCKVYIYIHSNNSHLFC